MKRLWKTLCNIIGWLLSYAIAVGLMLHPFTQPIAAGLAAMPVLQGVGDPHARMILGMIVMLTFIYLAMNFAELAALAVMFEVHKVLGKLRRWATVAKAEREGELEQMFQPVPVPVQ